MKKQAKKGPTDPLGRAIWSREGTIRRAHEKIKTIREIAEERVSLVLKDIEKKKVLLDALKRGKLKP